MAAPKKHGESTVHVTVRMPASLVEGLTTRYPGTLSEAIVEACRAAVEAEALSRVSPHERVEMEQKTTVLDHVLRARCEHPKNRQVQVVGGKRCLDCGEVLRGV